MKDFHDVLTASFGSAEVISNGLKEYGGSMGKGIRKIAYEAFSGGYYKGFVEGSIVSATVLVLGSGVIFGVARMERCRKTTKRKETVENEQNVSKICS